MNNGTGEMEAGQMLRRRWFVLGERVIVEGWVSWFMRNAKFLFLGVLVALGWGV